MKKLGFKQGDGVNIFQGFIEEKAIKANSSWGQKEKPNMKWNISSSLLEQYLEFPWA